MALDCFYFWFLVLPAFILLVSAFSQAGLYICHGFHDLLLLRRTHCVFAFYIIFFVDGIADAAIAITTPAYIAAVRGFIVVWLHDIWILR